VKTQPPNCDCAACPLKDEPGPVFPERGKQPEIAIVGEAPGNQEVRIGRPFVGPSGGVLEKALRAAGISRNKLHLTNAVMCQPPANDMRGLLARIRSINAERRRRNNKLVKEGKEALALQKTPQECCRPRLAVELGGKRHILAAGAHAAASLLGGSPSIQAIRGSLLDGHLVYDKKAKTMRVLDPNSKKLDLSAAGDFVSISSDARIVPTLHPAFVLRSPKWTDTFERDVDRLARWTRGKLDWKEPRMVYHPSPAVLEEFLSAEKVYTYDLETDGIAALSCNVRCVGIGTSEAIVIIGTRPIGVDPNVKGESGFYSPLEMEEIKGVLRRFFADQTKIKVGHNAGYYDRLVIRQWLGVDPEPTLDTILLHRLVESELPHSLGFVGSKYTDVHAWKADRQGRKLATQSETDRELHHYCGLDVAVTARVMEPLLTDTKAHEQAHLIEIDHSVQRVCCDMHTVGMFVDQQKRAQAENELVKQSLLLVEQIRGLAGIPDFNPASTHQLRRLLFQTWQLEPPLDDQIRFTATGDPSTGDVVLRSLLFVPNLGKQQKHCIRAIRKYRGTMKQLGTYVVKLQPQSTIIGNVGWDDDERTLEWEAKQDADLLARMHAEREKRGYEKRGIVWSDGRMRPGYNAHVTVSGRLSSSSPINAQNFPKHLRSLIIPQPGHVLVGADADQLELRIAASRWNLSRYLEAFDEGLDPHSSVTAYSVFGEAFEKAAGSEGPWKNGTKFDGDANSMRQLAKIIQYAFQYKASVETGHRIIQSTELADGSLPYAKMSVRKVRQMRQAWLDGIPELESGWDSEIQFFRENHFVEEPVHKRRRDCLDGENPNELVNFPIQGAASGLINTAMIAIHKDIPLHKWGPGTGLITQTHDSLVVECPEDKADEVKEIIEHHLHNIEHPDLPGVKFTAGADVGMTWKEVG